MTIRQTRNERNKRQTRNKRETRKTRKTRNTRKTRREKKTRRERKTRQLRGGDENEQKEKIMRDNFRQMFMNAYDSLQNAINTKTSDKISYDKKIQGAIDKFRNGFKGNLNGINTLIPIADNSIPVNKYESNINTTPLTTFVPLLVVIFNNINDTNIRQTLVNAFINNKGNINLQSYNKKITALSSAIKLNDKELVTFLLKKGANVNFLTEEQKIAMDNLMKVPVNVEVPVKEPEIIKVPVIEEPVIEEPTIELNQNINPIVKLNISTELPTDSGYNPDIEPEFWKPIFADNEMLTIRKQINDMMITDGNIPLENDEVTSSWSICKIIKSIIPTYFTPTKNERYESFVGLVKDNNVDFSHFNITLCAALIIFGLISSKMIGQDYKLLFKGGKAIQLVLADIPELSSYKSEDIDVLIMPDTGILYNEADIKNLSGHLAYLIRWFLNIPAIENNIDMQYKISVQVPNPENARANPFIFKLSYAKIVQKNDFRKNIKVDDFRQFSDIDFKELPSNIKTYFEDAKEYKFYISELNQNVMFRCPNLGSLLDEKIYYYAKYMGLKIMLQEKKVITEEGYQQITINDCDRFLEKFKRAILAMNNGLQKQRKQRYDETELLEREKTSIRTRLTKLGITDNAFQTTIVQSLYQ